jgi:TRAP-type mannitol/chloroaromatic compound transport system permease small subunit
MRSFLKAIDSISEWSGKVVSWLAVGFALVILYEVVSRYIFNAPTIWAMEVSQALYGGYVVLLGAYILREGGHVNVDIIYNRFSPRARAGVSLFTWLIFFLWVSVVMWKGLELGWHSLMIGEREASSFAIPLYPAKLCIPLGAFLLLLQGLAGYIRNAHLALTGREL